eukprot:TRINITY_DN1793_c0_g1_i1.p1 TRINITY_DN1793_c0_g1~~TRINITY_DN1793_c0_g1_i1.p1  ORF type:complete len:675 (-),score=162.34 TRINITY_DN1793_c0_g1_i1:107-2131(-)
MITAGSERKRVIVAGGTGFIGRHVVDLLLSKGHQVLVLSRGRKPLPQPQQSQSQSHQDHLNTPTSSSSTNLNMLNKQVIYLKADLSTGDPLKHIFPNAIEQDLLRGCVAAVNLVGIKSEAAGGQTFRRAHVDHVRGLLDLCVTSGIPHLVHVSVLCARRRDDDYNGYVHTKWEAEQVLRQRSSLIDWTILRPSVVFGDGDDMITNLVRSVKHCPVFPQPGLATSLHQPVHASILANAVARTVANPSANRGRIIEVVGPQKLSLRRILEIAIEGSGLPTFLLPTSPALLGVAANVMSKVLADPVITSSQLEMLMEGMSATGDYEVDDGQNDSSFKDDNDDNTDGRSLDIDKNNNNNNNNNSRHHKTNPTNAANNNVGPSPHSRLTPALVAEYAPKIGPLFGVSLRILPEAGHYDWLQQGFRLNTYLYKSFLVYLLIALFLLATYSWQSPSISPKNVWVRAGLANLAVGLASIVIIPLPVWRGLIDFRWRSLMAGAVCGLVTYMICGFGFVILKDYVLSVSWSESLVEQRDVLYTIKEGIGSNFLGLLLLSVVIPAEEIFWRGTLLLSLAACLDAPPPSPLDEESAMNANGNGSINHTNATFFSAAARRGLGVKGTLLAALLWGFLNSLVGGRLLGLLSVFLGFAWGLLVLRTKSVTSALVAHLVWDALALYLFPY